MKIARALTRNPVQRDPVQSDMSDNFTRQSGRTASFASHVGQLRAFMQSDAYTPRYRLYTAQPKPSDSNSS